MQAITYANVIRPAAKPTIPAAKTTVTIKNPNKFLGPVEETLLEMKAKVDQAFAKAHQQLHVEMGREEQFDCIRRSEVVERLVSDFVSNFTFVLEKKAPKLEAPKLEESVLEASMLEAPKLEESVLEAPKSEVFAERMQRVVQPNALQQPDSDEVKVSAEENQSNRPWADYTPDESQAGESVEEKDHVDESDKFERVNPVNEVKIQNNLQVLRWKQSEDPELGYGLAVERVIMAIKKKPTVQSTRVFLTCLASKKVTLEGIMAEANKLPGIEREMFAMDAFYIYKTENHQGQQVALMLPMDGHKDDDIFVPGWNVAEESDDAFETIIKAYGVPRLLLRGCLLICAATTVTRYRPYIVKYIQDGTATIIQADEHGFYEEVSVKTALKNVEKLFARKN